MATMFSSGDGYEGMMGRHSRKLAAPFADFAGVRDRGAILDVGCGTGSLTQVLADRTREAKIVGIDPSKGFVEHARKRFSGNPRVAIDEGSATALPYPAGSFDQTLTMLVLMFIPDDDKAIAELMRVTRPGGVAAACLWTRGSMAMNQIMIEEAAKLDPAAREIYMRNTPSMRDASEIAPQWRRAGLKDVSESSIDIQMEFDNYAHYWDSNVNGGGPQTIYLNGLAPDHRQRLHDAIRQRHLAARADGPYTMPARALVVRGLVPG